MSLVILNASNTSEEAIGDVIHQSDSQLISQTKRTRLSSLITMVKLLMTYLVTMSTPLRWFFAYLSLRYEWLLVRNFEFGTARTCLIVARAITMEKRVLMYTY